ncbi:MAG: ATP synthase F1 subunit gamma [Pseudomonadota bacterium]|nr:ATP synthase F1 subunit gamma [Pseudomonadota bacterium]
MAGLKELRTRIEAIKSTQKITSAMKMVAASRLRRVQILVDKNQDYAENLRRSALRVLTEIEQEEQEKGIRYIRPSLLQKSRKEQNYELYVFSSDRGLCGAYNSNVAKKAVERIKNLRQQKKNIKVICIGKKAYDIIRRIFTDLDITLSANLGKDVSYAEAATRLGQYILQRFQNHDFDVCEIIHAQFESAISRTFEDEQVCPLQLKHSGENLEDINRSGNAFYEYLPDKLTILEQIVPIIFEDTIFQALVNSAASEHGARMSSMDNATRNAKKMISDLTLKYNSLRQSAITTELIEIIAGADAV